MQGIKVQGYKLENQVRLFAFRVIDMKDVVLRLFTMMMENASNIAMKMSTKFSLMMENLSINAMDKSRICLQGVLLLIKDGYYIVAQVSSKF